MGKDYVNSVVTLLEDALSDRDHVHRQTAAAIVKHIAFGPPHSNHVGLGQEEALQHLLNLVWPNIFETSPHLIGGIMDAIEGTLGRVAGTPRLCEPGSQAVRAVGDWAVRLDFQQARCSSWPCFKAEDQQYFDKILKPEDDLNSGLTVEGLKDRKILCLLLTFELLDLLK
ncbi:U2 snRNP component prp10, partial [Tilletia horrida]